MRYYSIVVAGAPGVFPSVPGASHQGAQWDTFINNRHNPEAQQVEFSIEEMTKAPNPSGSSTLTIHGVSFDQIKQSASLIGSTIFIYGGMSPGLPLATVQSRLQGLLIQGSIFKCWGNWIGTEMSIGMTIIPAGDSPAAPGTPSASGPQNPTPEAAVPVGQSFSRTGFRSLDSRSLPRAAASAIGIPRINLGGVIGGIPFANFGDASSTSGGRVTSLFGGGIGGLALIKPANLIHDLKPGQSLSSAIQQTLSKAYPGANVNVAINGGLKLSYQDAGMYQNLDQYSAYIQKLSNSILGANGYLGVHMSSHDNTIDVWDGTTPISAGVVSIYDLIGQPTWIDLFKISVKTVMRSDLHIGGTLTLPPTLINTTPEAIIGGTPEQKTSISFTGTFIITKVLHVGDFRNPDGSSWSSNYEAMVQGHTEEEATQAAASSEN